MKRTFGIASLQKWLCGAVLTRFTNAGAQTLSGVSQAFQIHREKSLDDPSADTEFSGTTAVSGVITLDKSCIVQLWRLGFALGSWRVMVVLLQSLS